MWCDSTPKITENEFDARVKKDLFSFHFCFCNFFLHVLQEKAETRVDTAVVTPLETPKESLVPKRAVPLPPQTVAGEKAEFPGKKPKAQTALKRVHPAPAPHPSNSNDGSNFEGLIPGEEYEQANGL